MQFCKEYKLDMLRFASFCLLLDFCATTASAIATTTTTATVSASDLIAHEILIIIVIKVNNHISECHCHPLLCGSKSCSIFKLADLSSPFFVPVVKSYPK